MIKSIVKGFLRRFVSFLVYYTGLNSLIRDSKFKSRALVLMYHRVLNEGDASNHIHPGMYVSSASFERQLQYLKKAYSVIDTNEFAEWLNGNRAFEKIPCVITFDDGWVDNYTNAYPLLMKYRLPATIFIITQEIGNNDMLSWSQITEMENSGILFGSHTQTHRLLSSLSPEELDKEIILSKQTLHRSLKNPSAWFCYPKGDYSPAACERVREHYIGAFSTKSGYVSSDDDRYTIKRVGVHEDVSRTVAMFACRTGVLQ